MELGISLQAYQAATAWLFGMGIGICYDILKAFRLVFLKGKRGIFLDILFSLMLLVALLFQGMYLGRGSLRIFMLLANFLGLLVYFRVLSVYVLLVLEKVLVKVLKIVQFILGPIAKICAKSRKVYIMQKRAFQKRLKQYIIENQTWFWLGKKRKKQQEGTTVEKQRGKHYYQTSRSGLCNVPGRHANRFTRTNRGHGRKKGGGGNPGVATRRRK